MASVKGTMPTEGLPGAPTWTVFTVTVARPPEAAAIDGPASGTIAAAATPARPTPTNLRKEPRHAGASLPRGSRFAVEPAGAAARAAILPLCHRPRRGPLALP